MRAVSFGTGLLLVWWTSLQTYLQRISMPELARLIAPKLFASQSRCGATAVTANYTSGQARAATSRTGFQGCTSVRAPSMRGGTGSKGHCVERCEMDRKFSDRQVDSQYLEGFTAE
jgi:hypothetical protein